MTARLLFDHVLTELSKVNAPSLSLKEFNTYINKAINLYINRRYNLYDINQLTTDDLRVLKSTEFIEVDENNLAYELKLVSTSTLGTKYPFLSNLHGATYEVTLPSDYLHLLNCTCVYEIKKTWSCWDKGSIWQCPAKRLTADMWSQVLNDYYNRPTPENPYYYIHNVNTDKGKNPMIFDNDGKIIQSGTDMNGKYSVTDNENNQGSNFPRYITLGEGTTEISTVEQETAQRYGNASTVRMEIRYGKDNSVFELKGVFIDYIKAPQYIRITPEQMDLTMDTSQIMEYPDYVCHEIINELTHLLMERTGDPRLPSHVQVTQSIAQPAQALTQSLALPTQ